MPTTLTLKITLAYIKPPIWRRIVVPASYTFQQLHHVIQVAMGWENYHLWQFWDRKRTLDSAMLGPLPPGETAESWFGEMNMLNAAEVRLAELMTAVGQKWYYTYDMGDNWEHTILVEAIEEVAAEPLPQCLAGRRACPPEDCGGFPGYEVLVEMLEKKKHLPPHFEELQDYAPAHFDQKAVNEALADINGYINRIEGDVYGA